MLTCVDGFCYNYIIIALQRINRNYEGCISNFKILTDTFPEEKWMTLDFDHAEFRSDAMPQWEGCPEGLNDDSVHFLGTGLYNNEHQYYVSPIYSLSKFILRNGNLGLEKRLTITLNFMLS